MKRVIVIALLVSLVPVSVTYADPVHTRIHSPDGSPEGKKEQLRINRKIEEAKEAILKSGPKFSLVGPVERGSKTRFSINGEDFDTSSSTVIQGDLHIGVSADVSGEIVNSGTQKKALTIVVAEPANSSVDSSAEPIKLR